MGQNKTPTPPQKESAFFYNKLYKLSVGYLYGLLVVNVHDASTRHSKAQGTLQVASLHHGNFSLQGQGYVRRYRT